MNTAEVAQLEYQNDFFYIAIDQAEGAPGRYRFHCGINIARFYPLCYGKGGLCSNPAFKGLQLMRADVASFALNHNMIVRKAGPSRKPDGLVGEGWFREDALELDNATPEAVREVLEFSVIRLVRSVLTVCFPNRKIPVLFADSRRMQRFLESFSVADYKQEALRLRRSREKTHCTLCRASQKAA